MKPSVTKAPNPFPLHGWAGLLLVIVAWVFSWSLNGLRTHILFFPQWLGYCLVVDALTYRRCGRSLMNCYPGRYGLLFLISIPVWWIFEGFNHITQNWIYLGREAFSDLTYACWASVCFSTVIPAVFSTACFLDTLIPVRRGVHSKRRLPHGVLWSQHFLGWLMVLLLWLYPNTFFPFIWLSLFFIVDPVNAMRGQPSLIADVAEGSFRRILLFGGGTLTCGFFWEMWNLYAYPKWIYEIPYLEYLHVFEMPLAGYGGYIPFGWELFAIYYLLVPKAKSVMAEHREQELVDPAT